MKTLLAIEWLKIKRYRTFWILIGFFLVLLPLWNYQIEHGMIKMSGGANGINFLSQAYSFPEVWGNVSFWASIFVLFLSILIIILTTNEYSFRTHRQNVIDGWSRLEFFHAKVALVLTVSLLTTLYVFIVGLLMGIANSGDINHAFTQFYKLGYFFLLSVNYLGLALLISLLIRRSGLSIGLFLLYSLIIENILRGLLNWGNDLNLGDFLPLQASDELLPLPLFQLFSSMAAPQTAPDMYFVIASIGWCALYYFIGRRMLLRSDW
jgi:ABC-2 type transport system permease protein